MVTVVIMQFVAFTDGDCRLVEDSMSQMIQMPVANIRAAKLLETSLSLELLCISQCIVTMQCYYVTIDTQKTTCTHYTKGSTLYNTTNLRTYVLLFTSTMVRIYICLFEIHSPSREHVARKFLVRTALA